MTALEDFYSDYIKSLDAHEQGRLLLDTPMPGDVAPELTADRDEPISPGESVRAKWEAGRYNENVHTLYSDLKLIGGTLLAQHRLGSDAYAVQYAFFRFAVDLLLREAHRLALATPAGPEHTGDHYLHSFSAAFHKVFADVDEWYGESLYTITQNGPVFTSMTGKASIDPRETDEHGAIHPSKLLPYITNGPDSVLGFVSPLQSRLPHPAVAPTELLGTFKSPTETPLVHTRWIENDVFNTFAPTHDDGGVLVPDAYSTAVYTERLLDAPALQAVTGAGDTDTDAKEDADMGYSSEESDEEDRSDSAPLDASDTSEAADTSALPRIKLRNGSSNGTESLKPAPSVDVAAVLEWTPARFVDDDELEAAANGTELELVSRLLLELQYFQRERLAAPGIDLVVSDDERHIAFKIQNVLARLVGDADAEGLSVPLATKLPVLMRNYAGTLPYSEQKAPQPQRLESVGQPAGVSRAGSKPLPRRR